VLAQSQAPSLIRPEHVRPLLPHGVMSGDVTDRRAIVWSRTDRPARMVVDVATTEAMNGAQRIVGPAALTTTEFTARVDLTGSFRTPSTQARDMVFALSGRRHAVEEPGDADQEPCRAVAGRYPDIRGNFGYNPLDANKRRFCAEVPMLVQWDDHETRNYARSKALTVSLDGIEGQKLYEVTLPPEA